MDAIDRTWQRQKRQADKRLQQDLRPILIPRFNDWEIQDMAQGCGVVLPEREDWSSLTCTNSVRYWGVFCRQWGHAVNWPSWASDLFIYTGTEWDVAYYCYWVPRWVALCGVMHRIPRGVTAALGTWVEARITGSVEWMRKKPETMLAIKVYDGLRLAMLLPQRELLHMDDAYFQDLIMGKCPWPWTGTDTERVRVEKWRAWQAMHAYL